MNIMQKVIFNSPFFIHLFLFISAILCAEKTIAQTNNSVEGYYLDLKKDTVKGFFNFDDLEENRVAFYQNKTTSDYNTLRPNDVLAIETPKFSLIRFNYGYEKSLFLNKLFTGKIMLYKSYVQNEGEVFFLSTLINPEIVRITKGNPQLFLNDYFQSCKLDKNTTVNYSETSVLAAIKQLNRCADLEKKHVPLSEKTKLMRQFSASLGVKYGSFSFKNNPIVEGTYAGTYNALKTTSYYSFIGTINFPYNLSLKISAYKLTKSMIKPDTLFITISTPQYGGANFYYKTPLAFSYDIFEVPIELTYYFKFISRRITPMVSVGMSRVSIRNIAFDKSFNPEYYKYDTREALPFSWYTIPNPPTAPEFTAPKPYTTYFISGGLNISFTKHSAIELSVRQLNDVESLLSEKAEITVKTKRIEYSIAYLYTLKKHK